MATCAARPGGGSAFHGLGKEEGYEEGTAKSYHFTEAEKDSWANLFEDPGSEENAGSSSPWTR